ncbi:unnamed protein product [Orchesella dallaii]|uniref:ERAP1-like C-terminal domain-containing protein n=1 Tax=Orchesella dallaii TaxID=48710 RepID=A0ABP1S858_9HEXA
MLRIYYLLCIFALSSASGFQSKIENILKHSRTLREFSAENHFLHDRIQKSAKNSTFGYPSYTCPDNGRLLNETVFEQKIVVRPLFLLKLGIENETHFIITQEAVCNNQSLQLESTQESNLTISNSSSIQWLVLTIENGGLKQSQKLIQVEYNEQPFYLAGNTSEQVILIRSNPYNGTYFVLYNENLFNRIVDSLERNRSAIPELFRISVLKDYWYFAELGIREHESFLKFATNLINAEKDVSLHEWLLLLVSFTGFGYKNELAFHPKFLRANEIFESKINNRFTTTMFESQLADISQRTGDAWPWLCFRLDSHCRTRLKNGLQFWKLNPNSSLESITEKFGVNSGFSTECLIVAAGGKEGFDFILQKAEDGQVSFNALGCPTEPEMIKLFLSKIIDPNDKNFVSEEVKRSIWSYYTIFNNGIGTVKLVQDNSEAFEELLGREPILAQATIMLGLSNSKEQLKEIHEIAQMYYDLDDSYPTFIFSRVYESFYETIHEAEMRRGRKGILLWITRFLNGSLR